MAKLFSGPPLSQFEKATGAPNCAAADRLGPRRLRRRKPPGAGRRARPLPCPRPRPSPCDWCRFRGLPAGGRWRVEAMRAYAEPLLLWFTRGQGRITVGGITRGYGAHNAIYIPAGMMHGFEVGPQTFGTALFFGRDHGLDLPTIADASAHSRCGATRRTVGHHREYRARDRDRPARQGKGGAALSGHSGCLAGASGGSVGR
jgi:AraC family transcriptional activator of pobA